MTAAGWRVLTGIPVIGGYNTDPKADGRVTVSHSRVGYNASTVEEAPRPGGANVSRIILDTMTAYFQSVWNGTAPP